MDVALRLLPFFLMIAAGVIAGRTRRLDLPAARAMSAFVFWIAFPALLIRNLSAMPFPDGRILLSLLVFCAVLLALAGAMILLGSRLGWRREAYLGAGAASMASNIPFLAAPFAVSVFGPDSAGITAAVMAADGLVIVASVAALLRVASGREGLAAALRGSLANPLVVAAAIGALMSLFALQLSGPAATAMNLLAATASPVGLVALGVVVGLEFGRPERRDTAPVLSGLIGKLLIAPCLMWLALGLAGADPLLRAVATLMSASPTSVHVFIQSQTRGVYLKGAALAVVISSVLAMVTLSVWGTALVAGIG